MKARHYRPRGRLRSIIELNATLLLWSIGNGALWFLMPEITNDISGSLLIAGLLVAFPSLISLLSDMPIGRVTDRLSLKKMLITGFLLLTVAALTLPHATDTPKLLAFLLAVGLLQNVVYMPAMAYLIAHSKRQELSEYMGASTSTIALGYAIGPLVFGLLLDRLGDSPASLAGFFYAAMCLLSVMPALLLRDDVRHKGVVGVRKAFKYGGILLRDAFNYRRLKEVGLLVLSTTFLLTFYDGVVWMLEPVYGFKMGLSPLYVGLLLSAFTLPLILLQLPAGIIADRYGRRRMLCAGLLMAGLFTILFGLEKNPVFMIVHAFLSSVGLAMAWPAVEGMVASLGVREDAGEVMGVWSFAKDLGYVVGPVAGAFVAHQLNAISGAFVLFGFLLAAFAFIVGFTGRRIA